MDLFFKWALFASVQLAVTMSPGPAFVVSVRNATAYNRKIGVFTAFGLALGLSMHFIFAVVGLSLFIAQSVFLFNVIKYVGAAYLVYLGIKSFLSARKRKISHNIVDDEVHEAQKITVYQSVLTGFLTNLLNPKAVIFMTAVYAQFIDPSTPLFEYILYGATGITIEFLWFSSVSIFLTTPSMRRWFMRIMHWVERICGGLMIGLGVKLALFK